MSTWVAPLQPAAIGVGLLTALYGGVADALLAGRWH